MTHASPRRAFVLVAATLGLLYVATLAPGVTLWDAGEFASAIESLGVPHPPGTPLFILVGRAWRLALWFLPTAVATNLLSAVATAVAAGLGAMLVTRWTRDTTVAVAAGIAFGATSTVWLNATETEVYSASLLLAMVMVSVGFVAGLDRRAPPEPLPAASRGMRFGRYDVLLAYLFALTPPLHLSAMVAAPSAIALASVDRDSRLDLGRAAALVGAAVLATGVGTGSLAMSVAGFAALLLVAVIARNRVPRLASVGVIIGVIAVGATAFLYLVLRSRLDPAVNQGHPTTFRGVVDVIARRQYDVPGLWPRRAPFWLQLGNVIQYADWQFALGLDQWVGGSPWRTPFTVVFTALGIGGSRWHARRDRRSWIALLILVLSATLGVVVYLNLKAGPSFGYGVLPPNAGREARERDYFFSLGFAAFGLWIGIGAVVAARWLASRTRRPRLAWLGVPIAALPVLLNWRAVDRRREPAASLPNAFATATLESAPAQAVLFVAGDNDTYPLWYAQVARRVRPDVTIVTVPLIGAEWYRAELARRFGLYHLADTATWQGTARELAKVAANAERAGRPVAAAVAVSPDLRLALAGAWTFRGLVYTARPAHGRPVATAIDGLAIDSAATEIERWLPGRLDLDGIEDPAGRYLMSLLMCPTLARRAAIGTAADSAALLASRCNFR